jgi:integrase
MIYRNRSAANQSETTFETLDGHRCQIDRASLRAVIPRRVGGRVTVHVVQFPPTGPAARVLHHLETVGPVSLASSLANMVIGCAQMLTHMYENGRPGWSAEAFSAWLTAMRESDLAEGTQRSYAGLTLTFLEGPMLSANEVDRAGLLSARLRFRRRFKGFGRRAMERLHDDALTSEEYLRLIRAARLELEEVRQLLDGVPMSDVHPYAPFIVLAGAVMAVRASELNVMDERDIRWLDGAPWWNLHAPDKAPAQVPIHDAVMEALDAARAWDSRHRPAHGPNDPLLTLLTAHDEIVRLDGIHMGGMLYRFARKWFARVDASGARVLWRGSEKDDARPFDLGPRALRTAAISEWSRRESNPEKLRILARHRSLQTTERYYIKQAQKDYHADWSNATRHDTELLRAVISGKIATPGEQRAAEAQGALVEGGHCQEVVEGITNCERATDCRRCKNFRIHPEKREVFVVALERARGRADQAATEGLIRQAENYRGMVALNQAVIDRIDEFYADEEEAA